MTKILQILLYENSDLTKFNILLHKNPFNKHLGQRHWELIAYLVDTDLFYLVLQFSSNTIDNRSFSGHLALVIFVPYTYRTFI